MSFLNNLISEAKVVFSSIKEKVGEAEIYLEGHASTVIELENSILKTLESPVTETAIEALLPKEVIALIPTIENGLENAIQKETIGMKIESDVSNATGWKGKLTVLCTDLEANPSIDKGIVGRICAALLANLSNNILTEEEYQLYLLAKKLIS